jgi:hypothetical protein
MNAYSVKGLKGEVLRKIFSQHALEPVFKSISNTVKVISSVPVTPQER